MSPGFSRWGGWPVELRLPRPEQFSQGGHDAAEANGRTWTLHRVVPHAVQISWIDQHEYLPFENHEGWGSRFLVTIEEMLRWASQPKQDNRD
jgi:hypothetical protein